MRGWTAGAALAAVVVVAGCGDDGGGEAQAAAEAPTTTAAPEPLRILVSNDDGYDAEGIDALVEGLLGLDHVEVTVSAPLENQSGTSDQTTPGEDPTTEATTRSGYPALAVDGFPADSVEAGLATLEEPPHLVVVGVNEGQNIGPFTELSGTVGAARTAARAGVPALAVSQGLLLDSDAPPPNYPDAVELALAWVAEHRDELVAAETGSGEAEVTNLNVPTCPRGEIDELLVVPVADAADIGDTDVFEVDCRAEVTDPADDVAAFVAGHPVLSEDIGA